MEINKSWTVLVILLLLCSSIAVTAGSPATAGKDENRQLENPTSNEETKVNGTLTETFLELESLVAGKSAVYSDKENTLHATIENTGGSVGDEKYKAGITNSIDDIESLKENTSSRPANILLGKAIDELEDALDDVSKGERKSSFDHLVKAIAFLKSAGQKGPDTEPVMNDLGDLAEQKVGIVIDQAESNFGSESPDVQKGKFFLEKGEEKLEKKKYVPAMAMFRQSFKKVLGAYTCDANITVKDIVYEESEEVIDIKMIKDIEAEEETRVEFMWSPDEIGIHYLKTNLTGDYIVYSSPGEVESSPATLTSSVMTVSKTPDETYTWDTPEERTISPNDPHTPTTFPTEPGLVCQITVKGGDLIIEKDAELIFNKDVTLITIDRPKGGHIPTASSCGIKRSHVEPLNFSRAPKTFSIAILIK